MAGAKFQYDESGSTFFYFLLSFLSLIVLPCTYYFWSNDDDDSKKDEKNRKICHCEQCGIKINLLRSKKPWQKFKRIIIKLTIILGWIAIFATAYKCTHLKQEVITWDPFEILEIPPDSSPAEIKKAYRKLSLIYHPDKETGNQEHFVKLTKAYAALTDETSRKNWEQYGNPDGPGATSFGIALPSWIVEKENSLIVLGLYALVFMIALPIAAGIWWNRSLKYGSDQVYVNTTQLYYYFIHKTPQMILKRVIIIIAASFEFEPNHTGDTLRHPSDEVEVPNLIREFNNLGEHNKERPLCFPYSIKARALLWAHLSRFKLPSKTLEMDRNFIVAKVPYLIQEFVQCVAQLTMLALSGRIARVPSLDTLENAMKLSPLIVQALWDSRNSLLQLPHTTQDSMKYFQSKKRNIRTLQQLALMKDGDRRSMLSHLSDEQYENILNVLSQMPHLKVEASSGVLDDEDSSTITAGAIVTVNVSLTRQSLDYFVQRSLSAEDDGNYLEDDELLNQEENQRMQDANKQAQPPGPKRVWKKNAGKKGGHKGKGKGKGKGKRPPLQQKQTQQTAADKDQDKQQEDASDSDQDTHDNSNDSQSDSESVSNRPTNSINDNNSNADKNDKNDESMSDDDDWEKYNDKLSKKDKNLDAIPKASHSVHCPYFPDNKYECWWIYLVERKKNALASIPVLMSNLIEHEEIELKFTAPLKPGTYNYALVVRSDSYVDFCSIKNLKFDVKEAKAFVPPPQWDISEDEEGEELEDDGAVEDSDLIESDDEPEEETDDEQENCYQQESEDDSDD